MIKIKQLRVRAVRVPMPDPHQTASGTVSESPLVLTDVIADEGTVGHSVVFTYTTAALEPTARLVQNMESLVAGEPLAPLDVENKLSRRFRLLGTQGLVGMALAAIDMAVWDALARSQDLSLVALLGGTPKPIRAYGAVGYDGAVRAAEVAEAWASRGFTGVKAKIGYATVAEDVEVIRAIRRAAGDRVAIMVDYNQALTPAEAAARLRVIDDEGLEWVEEPTMAHDFAGHAAIAREATNADPVRRELVGRAGHAACYRRGGVRFHDAGRDEDWRRHRMAARGSPGRAAGHPSLEPPVAGDQRAAALGDPDGALAGVRGLVECGRERAADGEGRRRDGVRLERRIRRRVERGGDRESSCLNRRPGPEIGPA